MRDPTTATAWVVAPCPGATAVLAVERPTLALPSVTFVGHRVPTDMSFEHALQAALGVETHLIRFLDIVDEFGPDVVALVAPIPEASCPPGARWIDRQDAAGLSCHADAVERWFAEEEGAPAPRRRVPWYRPGWLEATTRWTDDALATLGHGRLGPLAPVSHTPYSAVRRVTSTLGDLYLKAVEPGEEHGAGVAKLLSDRVPGVVPDVVALEAARGWWLSRAVDGGPVSSMREALGALAEVQLASASWVDELAALGCPDRTLQTLAREGPAVITSHSVLAALDAVDRPRLTAAAARIPAWCEAAAALAVPACLQHGDFGRHNLLDGPVLLDWRGWIGHPFVDPHLLLQNVRDAQAAWDSYLAPWAKMFPRERLDETVVATRPIFNLQYLVQIGHRVLAVDSDPEAYEVWKVRQLSHNLRWFAARLLSP